MDRPAHVGAVLLAVGLGEAISATVAMARSGAGEVIDGSEMAVFCGAGGRASRGGLVVVPLAPAWRRRSPWSGAAVALEGALMIAAAGRSERDCAVRRTAADLPRVPFAGSGPRCASARRGDASRGGGRRSGGPGDVQRARTVRRTGGRDSAALNLQLYIIFAALTTLSPRRSSASAGASPRSCRSPARGSRSLASERRRLEGDLHDSAQNRIFALRVKPEPGTGTVRRCGT